MRMWMVDPKILCRAHLSGEHREMHILAGTIQKGNLYKLLYPSREHLLEIHHIVERHDELAVEMESRGYNHKSPLQLTNLPEFGSVDKTASLELLLNRCSKCLVRYQTLQEINNANLDG